IDEKDEAKKTPFWWRAWEQDGVQYLMIAGSLGDPKAGNAEMRGVLPPDKPACSADIGVDYCPYDANAKLKEVDTLTSGFMHVFTCDNRTPDQKKAMTGWIPWPIIIRTPS